MTVMAIETLKAAEKTARELMEEAEKNRKLIREQAEHKAAEYQTMLDNQEIEQTQKLKQTIEQEFADIEAKMIADCEEENERLKTLGEQHFDKAVQTLIEKVVM